jgi:hypothetical protein
MRAIQWNSAWASAGAGLTMNSATTPMTSRNTIPHRSLTFTTINHAATLKAF